MQRVFVAILSLVSVLMMTDASYAGWKIDKFKTGKNQECFIDKHGNYAYWFCGEQKESCNSLTWSVGQYKYTLKQSEVLTADLLKAGESDIDDEDLLRGKYICCHSGFEVKDIDNDGNIADIYNPGEKIGKDDGVFRLNEITEKQLTKSGKTCIQKYNACGNKIGECESLCGDNQIEINGKCQDKCQRDYVYRDVGDFTCVECPKDIRQGVATEANYGYSYCKQCTSAQFFDKTKTTCYGNTANNHNEDCCVPKSNFNPYTKEKVGSCWKCSTDVDKLQSCLSSNDIANYVKNNCSVVRP